MRRKWYIRAIDPDRNNGGRANRIFRYSTGEGHCFHNGDDPNCKRECIYAKPSFAEVHLSVNDKYLHRSSKFTR
jgi:hypothetical protein